MNRDMKMYWERQGGLSPAQVIELMKEPDNADNQMAFLNSCYEQNLMLSKLHAEQGYPETDYPLHKDMAQMYLSILEAVQSKNKCNDSSLQTKLCLNCEVSFTPKTDKGMFCSTRCRTASHRKKSKSK